MTTGSKIILGALLLVNLVTFCIYGWDKLAAKKGWRRTPEKTLLALAFIGGAPGAFFAMELFRHKTKHKKFIILVPLFLVVQAALAVWLLT